MEFTKMVSCSDSLSTSPFSIKNILNYQCEKDVAGFPRLTGEGFDDAACSIPRPIVSPVPYNPPPLMYPCASFGPPLHAPTNWTSIGMGKETVAWMPSTSFMTHQFFPGCAPYTRLQRRRKLSTKKKKRPLFSQHQVQTMENEFLKNRYITENKRAELSSQLDLTETQVKTWFQNRRTKWRKELKDNGRTIDSDTQQELQSLQGAIPGKSSSQIELCLQCI